MMKENDKQAKYDPLQFLSLKWRELLQRLAVKDRRDEVQEIIWLIEEYAAGRLKWSEGPTTPRVTLDAHGPLVQFPERISVRPMPSKSLPGDPTSDRE